MFTICFDFLDGGWSFYCVYGCKDEKEALHKWEFLGCPNTDGRFYIIKKVECRYK